VAWSCDDGRGDGMTAQAVRTMECGRFVLAAEGDEVGSTEGGDSIWGLNRYN
jgi:hypothetical protein